MHTVLALQALNLQQAANNSVQYTLHDGGVVDVVCVFPATLVEHDGANNRVVQLWSGCAWQGTNSTTTCNELFKPGAAHDTVARAKSCKWLGLTTGTPQRTH